ncbi:NAD-dependent epimerase/dehydratase family protein [Pelagicoccus sp. NFK12]|uniref:NAD-dependent epimerase/dehydratase family protein n=1 Tax=Pelagicoccus enzymogenes TaxID=2773457 RepID=A0A927F6M9_9BACT|nr:NAD-dependent epimerase/dehydratase family protein [Pelagicoccus enzymogenes]MBD5779432.1 NAD-dependent epimerase/dehydratase family protein [Pelagicoccus enzymogenes]MDQ8200613.1 NAD-dependent epimerase/dehydratase family protein [Pelagicoccus enzymogenes]
MKCLIIGSGRFIAPKLIEELVYAKHEVAILDQNPPPESVADRVTHIFGDKGSLAFYRDECLEFKPDIAVHLSANNGEEASAFLEVFQGQVAQTVVTSNTNVYLAHARLKGTEPGASLAVPINEESPLRNLGIGNEEQGDKLDVEKIMGNSKDPCTILRLPPVYGPNDFLRRFYPLLIRMIDDRPFVLLGASQASWRWTHAFVDDVAHAVALSVLNPGEKHRIYNVGEAKTPTMKERLEHLGTVFGWDGRVKVVSSVDLPDYLKTPGDFSQDMLIDSSRIRHDLGYKELGDYYDGLAESVEWYRDNPPADMVGKTFNYSAEDAVVAREVRD